MGTDGEGDEDLRARRRRRRRFVRATGLLYAAGLGFVLFGIVNATGWLLLRRWHASAD